MTAVSQIHMPEKLIELLSDQQSIYQKLVDLGQQQSLLVQAGDPEPLVSLLGRRQQLIDKLTGISGKLEPFRQQWPDLWKQLDDDSRENISKAISSIEKLIEQIMKQDQHDRNQLIKHRDQMTGQINQVTQGTALNKAYKTGGQSLPNNRYADRQG